MSGASKQTVRIAYLNANWNPRVGDGSRFEVQVVTEDGDRHSFAISAAELSAIGSLLRTDLVLLFDPDSETVIIANLVGQWINRDWTSLGRTAPPTR